MNAHIQVANRSKFTLKQILVEAASELLVI